MKVSPPIWLSALAALAFTLAVSLAPRAAVWSAHGKSDNFFSLMLGDARRLFANQFFAMADVYFHSGYYPSIFDQNAEKEKEMIAETRGHKESEDEEKNEDFFGKPRDWIDAFGRNFKITHHTHLENGSEREILPWLWLSANLDPQNPTVFSVGAYYLREHLHRPTEAEKFLREGIRNNPDNCELLFELGRVYHEADHDAARARNVWLLAAEKYAKLAEPQQKEEKVVYEETIVHLATLEDEAGNYPQAIEWLRAAQKISPAPGELQKQIDAIQKKIQAKP